MWYVIQIAMRSWCVQSKVWSVNTTYKNSTKSIEPNSTSRILKTVVKHYQNWNIHCSVAMPVAGEALFALACRRRRVSQGWTCWVCGHWKMIGFASEMSVADGYGFSILGWGFMVVECFVDVLCGLKCTYNIYNRSYSHNIYTILPW